MKKILAMFPGQGSQCVGMGQELVDLFPWVREVFEEAEDAIKTPIKKLCLEGPIEDLSLTANTQPSLLTISTAMWKVLKKETGVSPELYAGHSLGEYSALVASEKLDFAEAVKLVRKRGEAMQDAVPVGLGAMAAVLNFSTEDLQKLCEDCSTGTSIVEIANYNSPQQTVVAGHTDAVDKLCTSLEANGTRYVMLQVSAPFHSRLMLKAKEVMTPLLKAAKIHNNLEQVVANLSGNVESTYTTNLLIEQIDHPVRWVQTMETAVSDECEAFLEVGPGKVLTGLAKRMVPKGSDLISCENIKTVITKLSN